ncbi:MAG: CsgG/HfaB family protein [Spirochaetes bacterium]|nr:CsgG/HfaB family protein [Spirochaetota bacterium]
MNRAFNRNQIQTGFKLLFLFILAVFITGCSKTPQAFVVISPRYDPAQVQRVALIGFVNYPGIEGSGEVTASIFEKYLLSGGYTLVERRQVSEILKEQALQVSGALEQSTLRKIGRLLGVNALVIGSINDFNDPREQTVLVDMPLEHSSPVYGEVETTHKDGDTTVRTKQKVITGYNFSRTSRIVPQLQQVPAHVGLSARLVDVETGEVLWSASASAQGDFLSEATEKASAQIMKAVAEKLP